MSGFADIIQTPGGKVGIGVIALAAIGALVFQFVHMGASEQSRIVAGPEAVSDAQRQIDAINNMTTLSPEEKKARIAHFQGMINTASGSMGKSAGSGRGTQGGGG